MIDGYFRSQQFQLVLRGLVAGRRFLSARFPAWSFLAVDCVASQRSKGSWGSVGVISVDLSFSVESATASDQHIARRLIDSDDSSTPFEPFEARLFCGPKFFEEGPLVGRGLRGGRDAGEEQEGDQRGESDGDEPPRARQHGRGRTYPVGVTGEGGRGERSTEEAADAVGGVAPIRSCRRCLRV